MSKETKPAPKIRKLSLAQREDIGQLLEHSRNMASLLRAYENVQWIAPRIAKEILDKHEETKEERTVLLKRLGLL